MPPNCEVLVGFKQTFMSGDWQVLGKVSVAKKQAVLIGGAYRQTCVSIVESNGIEPFGPAIFFDLALSGWEAYDLESGLLLQSSVKSEYFLPAPGATAEKYNIKNVSCEVKGQLVSESKAQTNSTEKRLNELRILFDKGLINKEQYDKKTEEILKSL